MPRSGCSERSSGTTTPDSDTMSIEKLKEQARRHEQKEEWIKALDQYKKAIDKLAEDDQPDIGLYNRVGDLYVRVGNLAAAVEHYEQAVDLYMEAELPNNAIAVCKKVIRNVPDRHVIYLKMGQIRAQQGFIPDARTNFLTYAERVAQSGDVDESLRALGEFTRLAPEDVEVRLFLAEQLATHDRTADAVDHLVQAHQALEARGEVGEAAEVRRRVLELNPDADLAAVEAADEGMVIESGAGFVVGEGEIGGEFAIEATEGETDDSPVEDAWVEEVGYEEEEPSAEDGAAPSGFPAEADEAPGLPLLHTGEEGVVLQDDSAGPEGEDGGEEEAGSAPEPSAEESTDLGGFYAVGDEDDQGEGWDEPEGSGDDAWHDAYTGEEDEGWRDVRAQETAQGGEDARDTAPDGDGWEDAPTGDEDSDDADRWYEAPDEGVDAEGEDDWFEAPAEVEEDGEDDLWQDAVAFDPSDEEEPDATASDASAPESREDQEATGPDAGGELSWETPWDEDEDGEEAHGLPLLHAEPSVDEEVDGGPEDASAAPRGGDEEIGWEADDGEVDDGGEDDGEASLYRPDELDEDQRDEVELDEDQRDGVELDEDQWDEVERVEDERDEGEKEDVGLYAEGRGDDEESPEGEPYGDSDAVAEPYSWDVSSPEEDEEAVEADDDSGPTGWALVEEEAPDPTPPEEAVASVEDETGSMEEAEGAVSSSDLLDEEAREALEDAVEEEVSAGPAGLTLDEAEERVEEDPDDISLHQRRVELAYASGLESELVQAYLGLARALDRKGERTRSKAAYQQVLQVDPNQEEARAGVSDGEGSAAPVQEVASNEDYVDLGAMILGDDEEKTTRFTVAYEEPSGDEEADFAKMLSQFKEKVSENLGADDVRAHHDLGTAYKEMGLLDEAIAEFQAALRADASHLPTYELMGQTFMEMGRPIQAVQSLERALRAPYEVEDELVGIYYYLARAHETRGNTDKALEFYDRVFSLDINFADVTERLRALRPA